MGSSQRFGFPSQSTQCCDVGLACHASEVPETIIERARSCSAQFYLWRSIHPHCVMTLRRAIYGSRSKGFPCSVGVVHSKQKLSPVFFQMSPTCRIEVFFGTSGSSEPRARSDLICSCSTISSSCLKASPSSKLLRRRSKPCISLCDLLSESFEVNGALAEGR
jgi:hypothetical protein